MNFLTPFASGLAAAVIILIFFLPFPRAPESPKQYPQRFVLYQPDAGKVDIAGSFTDWKVMPMKKAGNSGYWEITLELPEGDHSFSYILDGTRKMPDPTVPLREQDDFGGDNSILHTEVSL